MVGQGWVSGYEFWRMAPGQVWWMIDAKMPKQATQKQEDLREMVKLLKEAKAQEAANG